MNGDVGIDPSGGYQLVVDVNDFIDNTGEYNGPNFGAFYGCTPCGVMQPGIEEIRAETFAPTTPSVPSSEGAFAMQEPLVVDVYGSTPEAMFMPTGGLQPIEEGGFTMESPLIVDVFAGTPTPIPSPLPEFNPFIPVQPVAATPFTPTTFPTSLYALNPQTGGEEPVPNGDFNDTGSIYFPSLPSIPNLVQSAISGLTSGLVSRQAPKAGLISGACPPGRVIRHVSLGRDICVKKRHMNICNRHALARASRRVSGFLTMAKNTEKKMRQSFAPLLHTTARRARGGGCSGCGAKRRSACVC